MLHPSFSLTAQFQNEEPANRPLKKNGEKQEFFTHSLSHKCMHASSDIRGHINIKGHINILYYSVQGSFPGKTIRDSPTV